MNTSTTRRRRFSIATAAIATAAAVAFGAAACGTETGAQISEPVAPAAPAPTVKSAPYHPPISADAAERQYAAQERPETVTPPGRGYRPIPIP